MGPISNYGFRPVSNTISTAKPNAGTTAMDRKQAAFEIPPAGVSETQATITVQPIQAPIKLGQLLPIEFELSVSSGRLTPIDGGQSQDGGTMTSGFTTLYSWFSFGKQQQFFG